MKRARSQAKKNRLGLIQKGLREIQIRFRKTRRMNINHCIINTCNKIREIDKAKRGYNLFRLLLKSKLLLRPKTNLNNYQCSLTITLIVTLQLFRVKGNKEQLQGYRTTLTTDLEYLKEFPHQISFRNRKPNCQY